MLRLARLRRGFCAPGWPRLTGARAAAPAVRRRRNGRAPGLESLEERTVLSTFLVTSLSDSGTGSLRDAITSADLDTVNRSTIQFAVTGVIGLDSALPDLSSALTITGPGASSLTIQRDAPTGFAIFTVDSGATVTIAGLTIAGGDSTSGGGIANQGGSVAITNCSITGNSSTSGSGGGVFNAGTATFTGCSIASNSASDGAGVFNSGTATFTECTFASNSATGGGGGIDNQGTATFASCTFSANSAGSGGGLRNQATASLINCTIAGNTATAGGSGGGGVENTDTATFTNCTVAGNATTNGPGGGVSNVGTGAVVTSNNTIIATNRAPMGPDFDGTLAPASAHNLIGNGAGLAFTPATSTQGNLIGTQAAPVNPLLGPLQNNGGDVPTMAVLPGSAAIDAGSRALAVSAGNKSLASDERGDPRVVGANVDIGAFESRGFTIALPGGSAQTAQVNTPFLSPLVVTVSSPSGDPVQGGVVTFSEPGSKGASLAGTPKTTVAATILSGGVAFVMARAGTVAESYGVTAAARGAFYSASFLLTNTPGPATSIKFPALGAEQATVGMAFPTLTVNVSDAFGNPVPGVPVYFFAVSVPAGPGGVFLGPPVAITNGSGVAVMPTLLAGTLAGPFKVSALAAGVATPVSEPMINLPGPLSKIVLSTSNIAFVQTAGGFPPPMFTVTAEDAFGNTVTNFAGAVTLGDTASLTASQEYVYTSRDRGVHTFTFNLGTPGTQMIVAKVFNQPSFTAALRITVIPFGITSLKSAPFDLASVKHHSTTSHKVGHQVSAGYH